MLAVIVIITVLLSSMVTGQTEEFEQECSILKTLDNLEDRLQRQEALLEQQTARLREQETEIAALKQLHTDCSVLYSNGTAQSGVYVISPDGRRPYSVYCDMTDGGWTVIQRRIDGAVNFHRTWDEYVQGFGNVNGEYWLGLEKIYILAKDGAEIYFDIGNYDGTREFAYYKSFTVHDVTTLYKMNVDAFGYNGSLAELFSYHNNMKFSTYDRDNDANTGNCALDAAGGGGWWYNGCLRLGAFNGIFGKKELGGIRYNNKNIANIYVKTVTIKLKQRPY